MARTILTERFERLNALAKIISASTYLEIGVAKGETFTRVDIPYKVGVDPKFRFNTSECADKNVIFHEVTSDLFFSELASKHGQFDLIFLDGLHTFKQTFQDFCSSLRCSHANTVWLIDDTHPSGLLASYPNLMVTEWIRRIFRLKDTDWMGDVFKVVFAIHDFFPQFNYATFPAHSQTVVWQEVRQHVAPTWNTLESISHLGYRDFLQHRDSHMSIMEAPEILEAVRSRRIKSACTAGHTVER